MPAKQTKRWTTTRSPRATLTTRKIPGRNEFQQGPPVSVSHPCRGVSPRWFIVRITSPGSPVVRNDGEAQSPEPRKWPAGGPCPGKSFYHRERREHRVDQVYERRRILFRWAFSGHGFCTKGNEESLVSAPFATFC